MHVTEDEMISNRRNRKRKAINDLDYDEERSCRGKVRLCRSELSELTEVDDGNLELYEQRIRYCVPAIPNIDCFFHLWNCPSTVFWVELDSTTFMYHFAN
jgi:hypothetical protein